MIGLICSITKLPNITLNYTKSVSLSKNFKGLLSFSINLISINLIIKNEIEIIADI